jgi:predicted TIM-barrel fold metal-dependent hydrolase
MSYVDAHHHIWPHRELPWLAGEMIPRIFGPYESLQGRDYTIEEYVADATANGISQSVYVQANWPLERSVDEVRWVQQQHDRTGWPHAIVGSADLFDPKAGATLEAQATTSPLMRGCRLQLHWHENPNFRFQPTPDRGTDPIFNENLKLLGELRWPFELQTFPTQLPFATQLVQNHPDLTFVLVHAGMPIEGEPWEQALHALAQQPNVVVKLSGQGTFVHRVDTDLIRRVASTVIAEFGSERAMFGTNFPIESIWTDFSSLMEAWLGVLAEFPDRDRENVLGRTARRVYRLDQEDHG